MSVAPMKRDYTVMDLQPESATSHMSKSGLQSCSPVSSVCLVGSTHRERSGDSPGSVRYTSASAPDRGDGAIMQKVGGVVKRNVVIF